jgi:CheY-like chemotaxis protein
MLDSLKYLIVEDKEADRLEVSNKLSDAGLSPENCLGQAGTYDEALSMLESAAGDLDVVFLDLNIPRNERDSRPERGHGRRLLQTIHRDLNNRAGVEIQVIIISAEDLDDDMAGPMLRDLYAGTLVGTVPKDDLTKRLKTNLKRVLKDPILMRLRRGRVDVIDDYETLMDNSKDPDTRLGAAKRLACRLVRYDGDYRKRRIGACDGYGEELNSAIKELIESRFEPDLRGRVFVEIGKVKSGDQWANFLWRGAMVQHLYTINSYRNMFGAHQASRSYRIGGGASDEWSIPPEVLEKVEDGHRVLQIVELAVKELLEWYLPWHEQVYLPWAEAQTAGSGGAGRAS